MKSDFKTMHYLKKKDYICLFMVHRWKFHVFNSVQLSSIESAVGTPAALAAVRAQG